MNIAQGCVVTINYKLTNDAGDILDTTDGREPLAYLHGYGGMIPGLERAFENKRAGDSLNVELPPEEGYGPVNAELIDEVPLSALVQIEDLEVGMQLRSRDDQGHEITLTVDAISESHATLNANHPMAGQVLHFDVSIVNVRLATREELAQARTKRV